MKRASLIRLRHSDGAEIFGSHTATINSIVNQKRDGDRRLSRFFCHLVLQLKDCATVR